MNNTVISKSHTESDDIRLARIRKSALRLFNEKGYGSTTMDDIARASGVGVGTIYRRFPDKPALANDLYAHVLESMAVDKNRFPETDSRQERFMRLWLATCEVAVKHPDMLLFLEGQPHEAYIDSQNLKKKKMQDVRRRTLIEDLGLTAPPEVIITMVIGMLAQSIRTGTSFDYEDLGKRLWVAFTTS